MRVAVYGGSFNPPHIGHGMVASWLKWTDLVDEVWLMPTFSHAFSKDLADFSDRFAWCSALAKDVGPWVRVTDIERHLPKPSYSIDSLRALQRGSPEHTFRFVIGADVLPDLPKWKEWSVIAEEFCPIVVGRDGYDNPTNSIVFPGISSTEIRRRVKAAENIEHLVSARVRELFLSRDHT